MSLDFAGLDVSRETSDRLNHYEGLLKKWNKAINLVSPSTISEARSRHFIDSAQIYGLASQDWKIWCDLGSGGGFPGLVVAIIAAEKNPNGMVTLVESDQRKAAFLRTVARETGVNATVISKRIEAIDPLKADVLSARALAPLPMLLEFCQQHLSENGQALFPKGATWQQEVAEARQAWSFSHQVHTSIVDSSSVILSIGGISRG